MVNKKSFGNLDDIFFIISLLILFSSVSARAGVNITIDGDVSDWEKVTARGTDADDMPDNNIDVKAVFAANDNDYLYLRTDVYGNVERSGNCYILYLDTDQNAGTGFTLGWWTTGADYRIYIDKWGAGLQKFMGTNSSDDIWGWDETAYGVKNISIACSGGVIEYAVPRLDIGETKPFGAVNILFRIWPGDDAIPSYDDIPLGYTYKVEQDPAYYGYWETLDGTDNFGFIKEGVPTNIALGWTDYNQVSTLVNAYGYTNIMLYLQDYFDSDRNHNSKIDIEEEDYWPIIFDEIAAKIQGYENNIIAFYLMDEPDIQAESRSAWLNTTKGSLDFDKIRFSLSADYNGDGKGDLAMFHDGGDLGADRQKIYVSISSGSVFNDKATWFDMPNDWFNFNYVDFAITGDFTGDGKSDVAMFYDYPDAGGDTIQKVFVYASNGRTFQNKGAWINARKSSLDFDKIKFVNSGDYNGDGKADIAMFYQEGAVGNYRQKIYVCTSNGTGFNNKTAWFDMPSEWFHFNCVDFAITGDFTGDGKSDVAMFYDYPDAGGDTIQRIFVYASNGSAFQDRGVWLNTTKSDLDFDKFKFVVTGERDDYNADNLDDICMFCDYPSNGSDPFDDRPQREFVYLSGGSLDNGGFIDHRAWLNEPAWSFALCYVDFAACGDFNGDGLDDVAMLYDYPGAGGDTEQKVFVGKSTGKGAWTNRALLERFITTCKNRFPEVAAAMNFTRSGVMLDKVIPNNIDWVMVNPYPFFNFIPTYPDSKSWNRYNAWVNTAIRRIQNDMPGKPILIIGQSFKNVNSWRMPVPEEENWFYDTVDNFNLLGLLWFKYKDVIYGPEDRRNVYGAKNYPDLIEVHKRIGNEIVNGIYTTSPVTVDGNFEDWSDAELLGVDAMGDIAQGDVVDWEKLWGYAKGGKLYLSYQTVADIDFTSNIWRYGIYIDSDNNSFTGFKGFDGSFGIGAEYLIEGGTLHQYTGNGTSWNWTATAVTNYAYSGSRYEAEIPESELGLSGRGAIQIMLLGNNVTIADYALDDKLGFEVRF